MEEQVESSNTEHYKLTEKVRDEISWDLKRTHTSDRMKTIEGQEELRRLL